MSRLIFPIALAFVLLVCLLGSQGQADFATCKLSNSEAYCFAQIH